MKKIKVIVVDDSAYIRVTIAKILASDPDIEVVDTANNGKDALEKINKLKPDVITLDIEMPELDGVETLKIIMRDNPLPVIMLSSLSKDNDKVMQALEIGAVDFICKPGLTIKLDEIKELLVKTVKSAANAKMFNVSFKQQLPLAKVELNILNKIVTIASSTGGPRALCDVIPKFPEKFPVAVLVVQHMPESFTKSLADRLNQLSNIPVKETEDGEEIRRGTVYIAKGGYHTRIKNVDGTKYIKLTKEPSVHGVRPSADVTFNDLNGIYGKRIIAAVLTGMGEDGADGAALIKKSGGYVIAQDEETSVVYGMPKAVVDRNAADSVLPIYKIADKIVEIVSKKTTNV